MSYEEAVAYLDALGVDQMRARSPSTRRIEELLELLDHPERTVPAIHITGTNGKTSTAQITTSLLRAAGLKVGTFTSPHLQSVTERIRLDGDPVPDDVFGDVFHHVRPYLEHSPEQPSYFEVLTAMFFLWAADHVEAMVVEVGLGGRWDATNVIAAPVSVLTNIGLDHTAMLGGDKQTIAKEKVGIIKPASTVVTSERAPDVLTVISEEAAALGASMSRLGHDFELLDNRVAFGGRYISIRTSTATYEDLFLALHGSHQGTNAAVALEAVSRFLPARPLGAEIVSEGFAAATAPGRLESVRVEGADVTAVLDVAHNPDGAAALVSGLAEAFVFERIWFVIGVLDDKDYRGMLAELQRLPCSVIATEPSTVRSVPAEELASAAADLGLDHRAVGDVWSATETAIASAAEGDLVCITGSHYVVGEVRTRLLGSHVPTEEGST